MSRATAAEAIVLGSLKRVNATVARKSPVKLEFETPLFGRRGTLNSLGLVHLVATIEQRLREDYSCDISLVDDRVIKGEIRPFQSVKTLVDYISKLLDDA